MMKQDGQLRIPEADPFFFLPQSVIASLERMERLSKKHPVNVLVSGRQGCGKSSLIRQFASRYKRPLATFQIGLLSEPGQLFGEQRLKDGETFYQEFLFPKAITTPGCVIHLEEINRPEHPKALNELYSVLSEDRCIWIDELGVIEAAGGTIFFATLNEGPEFTGVDLLDAALRDRFYTIHFDYLPKAVEQKILVLKTGISEKQAYEVVSVINSLRFNPQEQIAVSTRRSLMIAELVSLGATLKEAFIYSLQIDKDILESVLLSLHLGGVEVEESYEDEYEPF
jgi:nitric oxide reductase NorQ protein